MLLVLAASSPTRGFFTAFGAFFAVLGLIFLLIGLLMGRSARRFRRQASRAQGTIVAFEAVATPRRTFGGGPIGAGAGPEFTPIPGAGGIGGGIVYRPTVEFTTADGTPVHATSSIGTNPRQGKVGDAVTVLYDPRDPQRVRVDSKTWVTSCVETVFIVVGGVVAVAGIAVVIAAQ